MFKFNAHLILLLPLVASLAIGQQQQQQQYFSSSPGSCKRVSCRTDSSYGDYTDYYFIKHCPDSVNFVGYCGCDDGPGYAASYHECPVGEFFDGYAQTCRNKEYDGLSTDLFLDKLAFCAQNWIEDRSKVQYYTACKK